mmetsp:Transcript_18777/g.43155  ORF Transcript_18777/g.43155 Transcript_18777/m.43155 type:complete len:123 (+) Transcript_18777:379-747(+)
MCGGVPLPSFCCAVFILRSSPPRLPNPAPQLPQLPFLQLPLPPSCCPRISRVCLCGEAAEMVQKWRLCLHSAAASTPPVACRISAAAATLLRIHLPRSFPHRSCIRPFAVLAATHFLYGARR